MHNACTHVVVICPFHHLLFRLFQFGSVVFCVPLILLRRFDIPFSKYTPGLVCSLLAFISICFDIRLVSNVNRYECESTFTTMTMCSCLCVRPFFHFTTTNASFSVYSILFCVFLPFVRIFPAKLEDTHTQSKCQINKTAESIRVIQINCLAASTAIATTTTTKAATSAVAVAIASILYAHSK